MRPLACVLLAIATGCSSGSSDGGSTCDGLDQARCAARSDCVADTCAPQCTCSTQAVFAGCRGSNEQAKTCAHLDCTPPAACGDAPDAGLCPTGKRCGGVSEQSPSVEACCICAHPCASANDCDADSVCGPSACDCGNVCQTHCATARCASPNTCGADGLCHPRACTPASGCESFEECDAGTCVRIGCGDARCDGGFCVNGGCWASQGRCLSSQP